MAQIKPRTLSGFMELLPARQVQFDRMVETLRKTYSLYGFTPSGHPRHRGQRGPAGQGRRRDREADLPLHQGRQRPLPAPDLTVPLAKYVALHAGATDLPLPPLPDRQGLPGRAGPARPLPGEFYQADIDVIGDGSLDIINEAEIPSIIYKTFTALGLKRFQIRVNNRKVLNGLFELLGLRSRPGT